jgi:hypothetical protein
VPDVCLDGLLEVTLLINQAVADSRFEWTFASASDANVLSLPARALLHLPGLRKTWTSWLRETVLTDLLRHSPRAWLVQPQDMPPHGAIAGLEIATWEDLWRLRESGRAFRVSWPEQGESVVLGTEHSSEVWNEVAARLVTEPPGRVWLEELPSGRERWSARYERTPESGWELTRLNRLDS